MGRAAALEPVRRDRLDVIALPKRGEVKWVALDPVIGGEMQKTRPPLIVSPDELNCYLSTVIVAPVISTLRDPYRARAS